NLTVPGRFLGPWVNASLGTGLDTPGGIVYAQDLDKQFPVGPAPSPFQASNSNPLLGNQQRGTQLVRGDFFVVSQMTNTIERFTSVPGSPLPATDATSTTGATYTGAQFVPAQISVGNPGPLNNPQSMVFRPANADALIVNQGTNSVLRVDLTNPSGTSPVTP